MPSYVSLLVIQPGRFEKHVSQIAERAGLQWLQAESVAEAEQLLKSRPVDIVLAVVHEEAAGRRLLEHLLGLNLKAHLVAVTGDAKIAPSLAAPGISQVILLGEEEHKKKELRRALEALGRSVEMNRESSGERRARWQEGYGALYGGSEKMQRVYRLIEKTAQHTYPVLILGESGTGKELVARSIHDKGPRSGDPFVPVDCSALAPSLIESELFGHVRGAFTGASSAKQGLMESASGGTLFLDEIGNLPVDLQAKLLRAIQEKEIKPVGANMRVRTDARIIAATNRDLEDGIREGNFRQDLYFRLNVVQIRIPPLRDRREDIPTLVDHFLHKFASETGGPKQIAGEAMERLKKYPWPGNVRELENAMERAMALSSGPVLHVADLPSNLQHLDHTAALNDGVLSMEEVERRAIYRAVQEAGGDKLAAAKLLGIGKTTLYRKLKEYESKTG